MHTLTSNKFSLYIFVKNLILNLPTNCAFMLSDSLLNLLLIFFTSGNFVASGDETSAEIHLA